MQIRKILMEGGNWTHVGVLFIFLVTMRKDPQHYRRLIYQAAWNKINGVKDRSTLHPHRS